MYLVFVLALVATIIMFFVDSEVWLTVAVITSLWAAFFGAILVSRYSGILSEETSRRQELERRHRAEIDYERAEAQRREGELERDYNTRLSSQRDETLEAIRKELEVMREQLTDLSGAEWTDEQVSLKAQAERIIELERSSSQQSAQSSKSPAQGTTGQRAAAQSGKAAKSGQSSQSGEGAHQERSGARKGSFATGTFAAVRWSGSDSQETTQIPMVVDTRGIDDDQKSGQQAPKVAESAEAPAATETPQPDEPQQSGRRRAAEPAADEVHGRRRADEHTGGVTVAELMAQMKKNAKS
ncbi:MAG TPA: hypothetical protein H9870_10090 [Candidatus Corynebacterium avicola]|uniref:DUF6779 domain-containing protein n=1 Tax=Candidatus Corynebacterium avicola TaxID=2838527 RepID=A0A9D1RQM9_9CORY|nr:hypothetical protein [Candidatus Corynebacterium avicola]